MKTWLYIALVFLMGISHSAGKIKMVKGSNPGVCSKKNNGEIILVLDRQNSHKLIICTNDNGIFGWRSLDGSNPPGEFFSPGYDCSNILDKNPRAKDGFYWITIGEKVPRKAMMNDCLQRPCRWGFAFHHKYPIQIDYSGAFSYSTKNSISGINFGATALVGCDTRKCCGCYGPKNGKKNYCFKECNAQNGGKIMKNVFTWFWLRSSLPKRLWSKCMEYKVTENGATVWYKMTGNDGVPSKGRCAKNKLLFYDGMLVSPDYNTLNKAPNIDGMMVYRKDNNKLYVKSEGNLKELAEKKVVNKLEQDIAKLEIDLKRTNQTVGSRIRRLYFGIQSSIVLRGQPGSFVNRLNSWFGISKLILCWRASEDGWDSRIFHRQCDYTGRTLTLIKVGNYIFGGYSTHYWGGSSGYKSSSSNYIFSLRNKYNLSPFRSPVYRYSNNAIYTNPSYGPTFGAGHDIHIANNANKNRNSYTYFGYTYRAPSGYSYSSSNTQALLAGSYNFTPSEVEVYYYA